MKAWFLMMEGHIFIYLDDKLIIKLSLDCLSYSSPFIPRIVPTDRC